MREMNRRRDGTACTMCTPLQTTDDDGGGIDVGRHAFFAADSQSVDGLGDHVVGRFRTAATTGENVSKHVL